MKRRRTGLMAVIKGRSLATGMWYVILLAISIFGVAFVFTTILLTSKARKDYELSEAETVINSVAGNIEARIGHFKDISRLIMLNEDVVNFLRADEVGAGLTNDAKYGVMDILNVSKDLDSVFIFRNDSMYMSTGRGEYILNRLTMSDPIWQNFLSEQRGGAVVCLNANGAIYRKNGDSIITVARDIYDINTQKKTGILLVNASLKLLDEILISQSNSEITILSSSGVYLVGSRDYLDEMTFKGPEGCIDYKMVWDGLHRKVLASYAMEGVPLRIVCTSDAHAAKIPVDTIITLFVLFVAFVVAILVASFFVSRNINRPLFDLSHAMEETKKSGWLKKIDVEVPDNEIGKLAKSYNSMIEYLNDLFTKLLDKEKMVQKAEMRVLHEQIKPHFLYNSLETISYLALEAGNTKVYDALETLGSFYRNFLSKGDREISVRREISIVKDYLALQKLRYGDILQDEYEVEDRVLDYKIPKLLLQPLVENCIYHGIRPKGEPGIIRISAKLDNGNLVISVYDTGIGMPEEIIAQMLGEKEPEEQSDAALSGFGLRGTIERIRYYCDNRDVVKIESELGEYACITLTIPYDSKG